MGNGLEAQSCPQLRIDVMCSEIITYFPYFRQFLILIQKQTFIYEF